MTHFSPRYAPGNDLLKDLLQEARAIFPNTEMAYDFLTYEVPRRRQRSYPRQASEQAASAESAEEGAWPPVTRRRWLPDVWLNFQAIAERPTDWIGTTPQPVSSATKITSPATCSKLKSRFCTVPLPTGVILLEQISHPSTQRINQEAGGGAVLRFPPAIRHF